MYSISDLSSDKHEFSIGGGAKALAGYEYFDDSSFFPLNSLPIEFILGITLPTSYVYYINEKIGLGINYKFGFNFSTDDLAKKIDLSSEIFYDFYFDNSLSFVNKFGKGFSTQYLLLEYGILSSIKYMIDFNNYSDKLLVSLGPTLFVGSDSKGKNNFMFTIGGFIDTHFYFNPNLNINTYKYFDIGTGIELRWKYFFRK